ncbi:DCC1-like thiol-disulfide oxidoreductase family protein [Prochlorococcus marinus]|uniref:DCC1-like thiol-disulfide oxidoreductase family protein n=1 Tax=Prochlorococcus marinus TaxID=1219 RepID=UPI0022B2F793|nr:DCC1-like thiol-disulfide oxidoreductase family protein [Prochlorococcus marinus]
MESRLLFIYDGECPFCNHFAELIELKSSLPNISILNGRENLNKLNDLYVKGYDLNKGAILLNGKNILHGASAIHYICSQISSPSDSLLKVLSLTFSSKQRTKIIFPFLLIARRAALILKGIPPQLI